MTGQGVNGTCGVENYFIFLMQKTSSLSKLKKRSAIYKLDFSGGSDVKLCVCSVEDPGLMKTTVSDPRFSRHRYRIKTKKTIAGHIMSK